MGFDLNVGTPHFRDLNITLNIIVCVYTNNIQIDFDIKERLKAVIICHYLK